MRRRVTARGELADDPLVLHRESPMRDGWHRPARSRGERMARIPYVDPAQAPEPVKAALGVLPPLNVFRMLANAETAFEPYLRVGAAVLGELALDPKLRELAILQVAKQSDAEYEWVQHVAIGRQAGLSADQVGAVERGEIASAAALGEVERAVLGFTAEVVAGPRVGDAAFDAVASALSPREIVELLLTIGQYLMLARLMTALELEIDDPVGNPVEVALGRLPDAGSAPEGG
jgi:alkylhydroperoxidase family enzyme